MPQRLGQHFLKNKEVIKRTIAALDPRDGDVVIEVGPGHGELTEELLQYPVSVIGIEKDRTLVDVLRKKFPSFAPTVAKAMVGKKASEGKQISNAKFQIIHGDVLKTLPEIVCSLPTTHYKLVGNIPYYLTGHLFRVISDLPILPERTVFMIQKEVAERIAALPPRMNLLAASVRFWSEPKIIVTVSKDDFSPPPKVDSAVIALQTLPLKERGGDAAKEHYYRAVRLLFAQPRKTVSNNLKGALKEILRSSTGRIRDNNEAGRGVLEQITRAGISVSERPQNLSVGDIKKISKIVYNINE